jgi:hypothetical protein
MAGVLVSDILSRNRDGHPGWLIFFFSLLCVKAAYSDASRVDGHPGQLDVGKGWILLIWVADKVESLDVRTGSLSPIITYR